MLLLLASHFPQKHLQHPAGKMLPHHLVTSYQTVQVCDKVDQIQPQNLKYLHLTFVCNYKTS